MKTTSKLIIFIFTLCVLSASVYAADDSTLFKAIQKRDKAAVEALLAKGADVNAADKDGRTPLHEAASYSNKGGAELLLAKSADVNAADKYGATPLHSAATKSFVELLLSKGADVNARTKLTGATPLYSAVDSLRDDDVIEALLAKGADINAKDKDGNTPLHRAADMISERLVELLVMKGADALARNNNGLTPLQVLDRSDTTDRLCLTRTFGLEKGCATVKPLVEAMLQEAQAKKSNKQAGANPREALVQMTAQLKDNPEDTSARRFIIKLASELKPSPMIPEVARKHFIEGAAIVKAAKSPAQQALAAQSFTDALKIAPWWGDAYYNLGIAQELAEKYDEAEQAFNFFLLSNPSETEKREVLDRIYGLSAKRKLAKVEDAAKVKKTVLDRLGQLFAGKDYALVHYGLKGLSQNAAFARGVSVDEFNQTSGWEVTAMGYRFTVDDEKVKLSFGADIKVEGRPNGPNISDVIWINKGLGEGEFPNKLDREIWCEVIEAKADLMCSSNRPITRMDALVGPGNGRYQYIRFRLAN